MHTCFFKNEADGSTYIYVSYITPKPLGNWWRNAHPRIKTFVCQGLFRAEIPNRDFTPSEEHPWIVCSSTIWAIWHLKYDLCILRNHMTHNTTQNYPYFGQGTNDKTVSRTDGVSKTYWWLYGLCIHLSLWSWSAKNWQETLQVQSSLEGVGFNKLNFEFSTCYCTIAKIAWKSQEFRIQICNSTPPKSVFLVLQLTLSQS